MNLKLITLSGTVLDSQVYQVNIPTPEGDIGVYPDHEALVTLAVPGMVRVHYRKDDDVTRAELFAISGGIVEIANNEVKILVDDADSAEDIAEDEAREALRRAEEMRDAAESTVELEKAYELIDRQKIRLKVAEIKRRKRY